MLPAMATTRITNQGFSATKKASKSLWWLRSSFAWVRRTRLVKPRWQSFHMMAKPTMPRWPVTKIFADLLLENDDPIVREREENKNKVVAGEGRS
jgi:hypothetical protein